MTIDIKAPTFPESISEGTVATWHVTPGESIARDELLVDIETCLLYTSPSPRD